MQAHVTAQEKQARKVRIEELETSFACFLHWDAGGSHPVLSNQSELHVWETSDQLMAGSKPMASYWMTSGKLLLDFDRTEDLSLTELRSYPDSFVLLSSYPEGSVVLPNDEITRAALDSPVDDTLAVRRMDKRTYSIARSGEKIIIVSRDTSSNEVKLDVTKLWTSFPKLRFRNSISQGWNPIKELTQHDSNEEYCALLVVDGLVVCYNPGRDMILAVSQDLSKVEMALSFPSAISVQDHSLNFEELLAVAESSKQDALILAIGDERNGGSGNSQIIEIVEIAELSSDRLRMRSIGKWSVNDSYEISSMLAIGDDLVLQGSSLWVLKLRKKNIAV